ncbi:MAG: CRISPR-associated protein Csd2, partial [Sulfobacillus thermosulfidooxidans]
NRDPLADSDARRIFGEEDGRISLSDVSIKRDVRDYIQARYPDGGEDRDRYIFVREERTPEGKLMGRSSLVQKIFANAGVDIKSLKSTEDKRQALCSHSFDARAFGAVYSVSKENFHITGPVQFGWAHSLHPVETRYVQGTVVMPSADSVIKDGAEEGKTQGTIWTTWIAPFAVFAMPGVINATIAQQTGLSEPDIDLLLEALWRGTLFRQARGRGIQLPLLLVHVEYRDPFFRLGYLEENVHMETKTSQPTQLTDVSLNMNDLVDRLDAHRSQIARVRWWKNPQVHVIGDMEGQQEEM